MHANVNACMEAERLLLEYGKLVSSAQVVATFHRADEQLPGLVIEILKQFPIFSLTAQCQFETMVVNVSLPSPLERDLVGSSKFPIRIIVPAAGVFIRLLQDAVLNLILH